MASVAAVRHKEKVIKAIQSMEVYGLKKTEIKETLNSLLELYNNEWDFIEAENYRTLLDSIFEAREAQTGRGGGGGDGGAGRVTRARRPSDSGSEDADDSEEDIASPIRRSPSPPAASRRCDGRPDAIGAAKKTNSPRSGRDALPESVARAVNYHSGASVRTRAATLSLQGGGGGGRSPGVRGGRMVGQGPPTPAAAAAHEREKGKSPLASESRRVLRPQSKGVDGRLNHVTVKLEVSDSLPAPEGFEKVSFERVDGVIKVKTPNRAGASPNPVRPLLRPAVTTGVNIDGEAPSRQNDPRNEVFAPVPLFAQDPSLNVSLLRVKEEPREANSRPPDHENGMFYQCVQPELSLDVAAPPSPSRLQIVLHGVACRDDPPPAKKPSSVTAGVILLGPSIDQGPQLELEKQDRAVLPDDSIEDGDGNVMSLVDYEDDPEPSNQGTGRELVTTLADDFSDANIRPNFITSRSKRDRLDAQAAIEPKRQKSEAAGEISKSSLSTAPLPRRKLLLASPSPDGKVNADSECAPLEGPSIVPSSRAGVKRKLMVPIALKGINSSNGDHKTVRNGETALVVAHPCQERGKRALESRGDGYRSSIVKRVKTSPSVQQLKHNPADISRGTEKVPIPFVNDFTSETIDSRFNYIPSNVVYQNAYINISLARIGDEDCCVDCVGDCLDAPHHCPCTRETGGVFAYTERGLLKPELINYKLEHNEKVYCATGWLCPIERARADFVGTDKCKGHPVMKFVKECWHKCGCSIGCGNRVVQRGISRRLEVFFTNDGRGWGLRTKEDLPAGTFVCEYVGEIMTNMELDNRNQEVKKVDASSKAGKHKNTYPVLLDADWCSESGLKDEEALCLDATRYGNVARFINHRCVDATLIDLPVSIEGMDRHYYHVAFFTSRDVNAGEELTWDYSIDFEDQDHPIDAFYCLCKSDYCRGVRPKATRKHKK